MNPVLSAGLLIGVLCGVWTFVMGFTGWYRDPVMVNFFFLVILIELGGLYWGLRKTAAQGRTYGQQLAAGGSTPAEIEAAVQAQAAMATPVMNALAGFIGTVVTGIIGSAIIAIFVKAPASRARTASV